MMKMKARSGRLVWAAPALVVLMIFAATLVACAPIKRVKLKMESETFIVKLKGAKSVRADIDMDAGRLSVGGGADDLLDAKFTHGANIFAAEVDYDVRGDTGELSIRPGKRGRSVFDGGASLNKGSSLNWALKLNDEVPLELSISLGVGESNLRLADLNLDELDIQGGAGSIALDLDGRWQHDVEVSIDQGVGSLDLRLPKDLGVRVDIDSGIGGIHADGFKLDGGDYVNDAYSDAKHVLEIELDQGVGSVTLELAE